jgi:hypothetical protein
MVAPWTVHHESKLPKVAQPPVVVEKVSAVVPAKPKKKVAAPKPSRVPTTTKKTTTKAS